MSVETSIRVRDLVAKFAAEVAEAVAQDTGPKAAVQVLLVQSFASTANAPVVEPALTDPPQIN